jgi:hypothetical protein
MLDQSQETLTVYEQAVHEQIRTVIAENPQYFVNFAQQYSAGTNPNDFLNEFADNVLEEFFSDEFEASEGDKTLTSNLREAVIGGLIASYVSPQSLEVFGTENGIDTEYFETDEFALMLIQSIADSLDRLYPDVTNEQ